MMVDSARNQPRLVFIRSAIRNLMLLTACVQLTQAQAPQRPAVSMSAPACSVKQVNDSKVSTAAYILERNIDVHSLLA